MAKRKSFFRPVHIYTLLFVILYFIFSNIVFIGLVSNENIYASTLGPFIFGFSSAQIFFYLFSHEDFFSFMGLLEKEERRQENDYLAKFSKYGKFIATVIIGMVGGPMFLALSVRFLFHKRSNGFLIIFLVTLIDTIFTVSVAKGLISFLFR